jgi:putative hydrolase of the HAD superfamily
MIQAVCFDFDGTLAHFTGDFFADLRTGATELGIAKTLHDDFITTYLTFDKSCATFPEAVRATLEVFQQDIPVNFEGYCQRATQKYASQIELLPGAREVLEDLHTKNIPLALITNGTQDIQAAAIHQVNIQHYFKTVLISGEHGVRKPDSRMFTMACERLETLPKHCLMVGDKLDADIAGAKNSGMQTVWMSKETQEGVLSFKDLYGLETWLRTELSTS